MGTKAVFSVKNFNEKVIGMTSDGFPSNLEFIAKACLKKAIKLRVKTLFNKQDKQAILKVLEAVVADHQDWLFLDDPQNPIWVSHSAVLDIKALGLSHYEGYEKDLVKVIPLKFE